MKKIGKITAVAVLMTAMVLGPSTMVRAATATVDLGTAGNFAVLAGTPVLTNTGNSVITGDVGLSPAGGGGFAGFPPAVVHGTIYAVDAFGPSGSINDPDLLTIAKNDLTAAYGDAAGRTPVTTVTTELGGLTLTSGVYTSASTALQITAGAGALVLDGQNDPNAVFIFEGSDEQAGSLTVGPGSTVSLINGAQPCNVFWRVYGATIDTTAVFKGNLMALTSITVADGANIEGRLLARNGQVTLINDTITAAVCAAGTDTTTVPGLPETGVSSTNSKNLIDMLILAGIFAGSLILTISLRKREI